MGPSIGPGSSSLTDAHEVQRPQVGQSLQLDRSEEAGSSGLKLGMRQAVEDCRRDEAALRQPAVTPL